MVIISGLGFVLRMHVNIFSTDIPDILGIVIYRSNEIMYYIMRIGRHNIIVGAN